MKKIFIYFLSFLLLTGTSCTDVLNQKSVDSFDEDVVFSDITLVKAYVGACYSMLGSTKMDGNALDGPLVRRDLLSSSTDQTLNNFRATGELFLKGTLSPDQYNLWSNNDNGYPWLYWSNAYTNIQNLNTILSRIDDVPVSNSGEEDLRTQLKGEAYFLRALEYTYLLMMYGGVILTDQPYKETDDFSIIQRSSLADTKDFILADVDKAIEFLPATTDQGRATRGAAAAVKSRMLLFCAGKLANGGWTEQANNPLVSFPAGSQTALLQAARDAAKDIMDGKYGNYALVGNTSEPVLPLSDAEIQQRADDYFSIFHQSSKSAWNSEIIWGTQFVEKGGRTYQRNLWDSPRGYSGDSNNAPTEEAVREFEMADGSQFIWDAAHPDDRLTARSATADELAANPYLNPYYGREARFYASVLYNRAPWIQRPDPVVLSDPYNRIQLAYLYRQNKVSGAYPANPNYSGVDTQQSTLGFNTSGNATKTGYTLRKFLDPSIPGNLTQSVYSSTVWIEFRYAEILLNYAEACIELGGADLQNGINALNLVRHRAGLPSRITTDRNEAREFVRHERDIELFGEGQRFFDIRRWMICDQIIKDVYLMRINEYVASDDDNNVLKTTWQLTTVADQRIWAGDYFYWFPIPRTEINKALALEQNPGYN
ncbi:MAG: RagB/SusD family nutrient uptake outer membrane protein [Candidatus Azobacteroides sp.]|nr:RagB/SusD family nutrient uptake outer membrane protein [Candidatus Azobacteroides sp.]